MKKNYIAPATENVMFGTSPIMDGIAFAINTGSGGAPSNIKVTTDETIID